MFFLEHIRGTAFVVLVWQINGELFDEMVPSAGHDSYHLREGERRQLTFKEFRELLRYCPTLSENYHGWLFLSSVASAPVE